jgi:uncharacterized membrane protein
MNPKFSFAFITLMLVSNLAYVQASANYNYYGAIVDDDGSSLNLVEVDIYNEFGTHLQTREVNGTFSFFLNFGSYQLVFTKNGYITDTRNYASALQDVNIGEIKLKRSVSMKLTDATVVATPGSRLTMGFQIKNSGTEDEIVALETSSEGGWATMITDENSEVKAVALAAGASQNLNILTDIPIDASSSIVSITAHGLTISTKTINVQVEGSPISLVGCKYPSKQAQPGSTIDFKVDVINPTEKATLLTLSTLSTPNGWSAAILNAEKERISSIYLAAKAGSEVTIRVDVPENAVVGSTSDLVIQASSQGRTSEVRLKIEIYLEAATLSLSSKYPSQSIQLGVKTIYPLTLTLGSSQELVELKAEGIPTGWSAYFKTQDGRQINSILIDSNASEQVNLEVTPALSSAQGSYDFTIKADGKSAHGNLALKAQVASSYGIKMSVESLYVSTSAKATESVSVKVTNTGYSPINDLELKISYPDSWEASFKPLKVTTIAPNEAQTFLLTFTVPEGASPKDYLITVQATSTAISTDLETIRVTVSVETSWSLYGITILAVSLVAFAVLFSKLRRK